MPVHLLALTTLLAGAAQAQTVWYVPIPGITPGVTDTKVELGRTDTSLNTVQATFIGEGQSGLDVSPSGLKAYIGPSTSKMNPLLQLTPIINGGGMVVLEPEAGLNAVEVGFEVEEAPIRTAWKLPLLAASDFFAPGSTIYVLNLVKGTDAASRLQIFNLAATEATCNVQVLRPKGSVIEERDGFKVPAVGVLAIPDILRKVGNFGSGINTAVTCDSPFYALGSYPATNRWNSQVEYPVEHLPLASQLTAETLDSRPGMFFHVTKGNSDLHVPVNLDPSVYYHSLSINFDVAVVDPPSFVVFRNVIGMFRFGGRRFGKTLFFGSFENFGKQKYVIDLGSPFIETTLKRSFPLLNDHTYHFSITLNNDQRSIHYVITNHDGTVVADILGGLYNDFNAVGGNAPIIEMGLGGVADNAYFPPLGWRFSNFNLAVTH